MNWRDTFASGLEAIRAHRLRSVLTMLGIVIGISSVILTVGLGLGAQATVAAQIDALGSNLLIVSPGSSTSSSGQRGGFGSASTLTLSDSTAVADTSVAPDVKAVAPVVTAQASLVAGTTNWTSSLVGTTTSWLPVRNRTLSSGRFFGEGETNVVVLGPDTASELFGRRPAVGRPVSVAGRPMTVIGVLASTGASSSSASDDDMALMPLSVARSLTGTASAAVSTIYVQASAEDTLSAAYQEIDALLRNLHGDTDFSIASQESLLETANATNETLTILLGGVAAISLLVGGIGVMNIMLVAVTERVREIGLRKALGATPGGIRRQFLVEAGVLGACGGLLGAALGIAGAFVLPRLIAQPVSVSVVAIAAAIGVSLAIGIGFGVYPATRAARLTPIDALRSE
ncbi:ABC transporter permease [Actinophytocola sp.]|uniref:ABC transporter permease n=1 Tax=Actinophytocola sp. TaxID=1872138 RepID=UPI002D5F0BD4|nr:ABC transporter permease [Actinophytocola sp.]HYQ65588.1 ABC transporter permease [Actinophytocola sp.]